MLLTPFRVFWRIFMSVYVYLEFHRTAVSEVSKVHPISANNFRNFLYGVDNKVEPSFS